MDDIRLLTLFKQHYLDDYSENSMPCQISCLGYYDGLNITEIKGFPNIQILDKDSRTPISDIWYDTGEKIKELKGGYSNQNIAIFRCFDTEEDRKFKERYWDEEKKLPFFAVGFLKIQDYSKYTKVCKEIESEYNSKEDSSDKKICLVLGYCTFDNADLILLLKSNSIVKLKNVLREIEEDDRVIYVHSIIGVEENYLEECVNQKKILQKWKEKECCIDEKIFEFTLNLATSGNNKILGYMKGQIEKWHDIYKIEEPKEIISSYMLGHVNLSIILYNIRVENMLLFLLPSGIATHKNKLYGNEIYNIESTIRLEDCKFQDIPSLQYSGSQKNGRGWCRNCIQSCQRLFDECQQFSDNTLKCDESLYSYFYALIQTLNMLDQYEGFKMSNDIFYLLYRSFSMFIDKLDQTLGKSDCLQQYNIMEELKKSICRYLECVNSVIYHTVHTDQVYLMIPGYSGTPFSIPIKLNMFYLYFVESISELMKEKNREYSFILTPVMESRPRTDIIKVGNSEEEKIICVQLSQRSLYFLKDLMIILTHELGHYIGGEIRDRKTRIDCLVRTMSYYLAEGIIPESTKWSFEYPLSIETFNQMKKAVKENLEKELCILIFEQVKKEFKNEKYYAAHVKEVLKSVCLEVISEDGYGRKVIQILNTIPAIVMEKLDNSNDVIIMKFIYEMQEKWHRNRRKLLSSRVLEIIIMKITTIYQEVFCDVAAISILDCSLDDYREAFNVSEGVNNKKTDKDIKSIEQILREYVIEFLFPEKDISDKQVKGMNNNTSGGEDDTISRNDGILDEKYLVSNMPNFVWVKEKLKKYSQNCKEKIQEKLKKEQNLHDSIKMLYKSFEISSFDCNSIYDKIICGINKYTEKVQKKYQDKRMSK